MGICTPIQSPITDNRIMSTHFTPEQKAERARAYFLRAYAGNREMFEDVWQRYQTNYNGMRAHWDAALPFILGDKEIPLNESRGNK